MWLQGNNGFFEYQTFARQKLPKSWQRALNQAVQSLAAFKDGGDMERVKPRSLWAKAAFLSGKSRPSEKDSDVRCGTHRSTTAASPSHPGVIISWGKGVV
jgi:hypothetical protein